VLMLISMRRQLVAGIVAVLVVGLLPGLASAKVSSCGASVSPSSLSPGTDTDLTVSIVNISGPDIVWVQLVRPNADYSVNAAASDGWDPVVNASSVVLTGGDLSGDGRMTVDVNVHAVAWESDAANWTVRVSDSPFGASATDCTGARSTTIQTYLAPDNAGAGVSNVAAASTATSVAIQWDSDVATGSGVSYGLTSDYGGSTAYDPTLATHHSVSISGLEPETGYHFQVAGLDSGNAPYFSGDNTFLTLAAPVVRGGPGGGGNGGSGGATPVPTPVAGGGAAPRGTIAIKAVPTETVAPTVEVTTNVSRPFTKDLTISGVARDNVAVARVDYSLDGGKSWIVVPSPPGLGTKQANFSFAPINPEDGNYSLVVRATDTSGNVGKTNPATLVIDRLPPRMGGVLVSFGPQVATLDAAGRWRATVGVDETVTMNAVGGPVSMVVAATRVGMSRVSQNFYLRKDNGNGLWKGLISFSEPGTYELAATAVDGAGNTTTRQLSDVVVSDAARVVTPRGAGVGGATVTLYYRQPGTQTWLEWDGGAYGQVNPQRTRATGMFAMVAPPGTYYLKAEAAGYRTMVTQQFSLDRPTPLGPALRLAKRAQLRVGPWSWTLPGITLTQITVDAAGTVSGGPAAGSNLLGRSLPAFRLPTTSGGTVTPVGLQGKPTVVTMMSTWAPPADGQLAALAQLQTHHDVNVVPLYLGEHVGRVQTALARGGYELSATVDTAATLSDTLGVPIVPTHYFVDRNGKVGATYTGFLSADQLLARLGGR
jgi:hypothetical protein